MSSPAPPSESSATIRSGEPGGPTGLTPTVAVVDGSWTEEFFTPFVTASRTPWERRGDLDGQMGANAVATRRLVELIESEGMDRFRSVSAALLDYGERRTSAALADLPAGSYT